MALEHYSANEIPTSAKFNLMVDQVNENTTITDKFFVSELVFNEDTGEVTGDEDAVAAAHSAQYENKTIMLRCSGGSGYIVTSPCYVGSTCKFSFEHNGKLYVCEIDPSNNITTTCIDCSSDLTLLRRDLGQYTSNETYAALSVGLAGKAVGTDGSIVTKAGYAVSNDINITKGSTYLFASSGDISDVALFAQKIVADIDYITRTETITNSAGEQVTRTLSKTTAKGADLKPHTYTFVYNSGTETATPDDIKDIWYDDNGRKQTTSKGASYVLPTQYTEYLPMFSANGVVARPIDGHYCLVASVTGVMVISGKQSDMTGYLIEVRYGAVASIINNLARKADVDVMSQLYREGVVSQTITYNKEDGTHTLSNVKRGIIPMASINQWVAAGALFNDTQNAIERDAPWGEKVQHLPGYFYLNGLGDISSEEMERVYNASMQYTQGSFVFTGSKDIRTTFPLTKVLSGTSTFAFAYSNLEIISLENMLYGNKNYDWNNSYYPYYTISLYNMFNYANQLKYVVHAPIDITRGISYNVNDLGNCANLIEAHFIIKYSINMRYARKLNNASILYMITNAANGTTDITITLHHDAYMRAIADTDIQAALEANGHLTLACATAAHTDADHSIS